ncbi:MAG: exodeoxyribonuclease VII large subunit [Sedimentisphaerales bacterium]|nr:exodeoxyribonuclease VII large subunit [Sedimentisphaerales bacterium]
MKDRTKIYTVSQVNSLIKEILENNLPGRLTITGEITDFKLHHSGHCYFSLKDENALLPCVMWKSNFSKLRFEPENGMAVLGTGFIDVYEPQGKYQFYVERMEPAGVGALQLAFEQMVRRLEAQGLFDDKHKKALPPYPGRIGILTSESGAAIEDIKDSIWNRWPCVKLFLYPVPVQGEGAAEKIAAGLRDINRRNKELKLDILIVGRGGGSMEDLWAFNEEVLARAIFDSKIPVISAVGHEVDVTIADFVADARASTPTKAGVIAVPDIKEVLEQIDSAYKRIRLNTASTLKLSAQKLETILAATMFRSPLVIIQNREQMLDELESGLAESAKSLVLNIRKILQSYFEQILKIEPYRILADRKILLNNVSSRINERIGRVFANLKIRFETQAAKLSACNPKSILNRGYSIAKNTITGKVVTSPADVNIGDLMITELTNENIIESKVTKK